MFLANVCLVVRPRNQRHWETTFRLLGLIIDWSRQTVSVCPTAFQSLLLSMPAPPAHLMCVAAEGLGQGGIWETGFFSWWAMADRCAGVPRQQGGPALVLLLSWLALHIAVLEPRSHPL